MRKRGLAASPPRQAGSVPVGLLAALVLTGGAGCGARTAAHEQPPTLAVAAAIGATPAVSSYRVGTAGILVTDPAGITPGRGSVPAQQGRRLPTSLWFPVAGPPATADAPGARPLAGSFPLVVFAHGFAVTPRYYEPLLHELAAHGYVVAAPLFPISAAGPAGAPREDDMSRQPGDITAVITTLTRLAARPGGAWSGVADPARVAIAGHSDGAESVAAMVLYPGGTRGCRLLSCCPGGPFLRRCPAAHPFRRSSSTAWPTPPTPLRAAGPCSSSSANPRPTSPRSPAPTPAPPSGRPRLIVRSAPASSPSSTPS